MERDVTILPYVAWNDMLSCCHGSSTVPAMDDRHATEAAPSAGRMSRKRDSGGPSSVLHGAACFLDGHVSVGTFPRCLIN